jgi:hypothetical protein
VSAPVSVTNPRKLLEPDPVTVEMDLLREREQVAMEVLGELTGLTLTGVRRLLALHRQAEGNTLAEDEFAAEVTDVLDALSDTWQSTTEVTTLAAPAGSEDWPPKVWKLYRATVMTRLRFLERQGKAEWRVEEDLEHGGNRRLWRAVG